MEVFDEYNSVEEEVQMNIGDSRVIAGEARILHSKSEGKSSILGLEVSENFQKLGYGRRFVEHIEEYLKKKGAKEIWLEPLGYPAEQFWKHMGYEWEEDAMKKEI